MSHIYDKSFEAEVLERLARIETYSTDSKERGDDHESRIRSMEKKQWWLAGAAAVLYPLLQHTGLAPWLKA